MEPTQPLPYFTSLDYSLLPLPGGIRHYECEQELLKDGSRQRDIWGADWSVSTQEIVFESIINIRPSQNNRSMVIRSPEIRERVTQITQQLLGGL